MIWYAICKLKPRAPSVTFRLRFAHLSALFCVFAPAGSE